MKETYFVIKKLTFSKIINYLKLNISYFFYFNLNKKKINGLPYSLSVETTNICNLNCLQCPTGQKTLTRPTGNITTETFNKIITQNKKNLISVILYFQGEPFISDKIYDFINIASENKIYTITSTNGHFLNKDNCKKIVKSKLNKLIISLDGTSQETYETYRKGGNYNTVIEGIKNITEAKKQTKSKLPIIELQFLVFRHNQHQINEFKQLAKHLKVDKYKLKTAQIYDFDKNSDLIPTIDKYSRYKLDKNGNYKIKNKLKNRCYRMWTSSVVTWNGNIVPCCFDKDAKHKLGNINSGKFADIWQ
ncbi:MAG: radical SAM protein, partial [Bacteroidetes bacterium]